MNCYKFNDINLNDEVTFEYTIDQSKMDAFRMITGDSNPLHCDLDYAKEQGYDENVVYGMLSASILSTLAGMYIPGKYSLIHSVEINFTKPVFISRCPLTVHAKVIEKDERFSQIVLKYDIKDTFNDKVCRGKMKIGVIK